MDKLEFRPARARDRELLEKYLSVSGHGSECAFTNHYLWRDTWFFTYAIFRDALIIRLVLNGDIIYMPPLGAAECDYVAVADAIAEHEQGHDYEIHCIYEDYLSQMQKMFPDAAFREDRNEFDYIYLQQDLANLSGRKYHGQKNHYNAFCREYPDFVYEKIDSANLEECLDFAQKWCDNRRTRDSGIIAEKFALQRAFCEFTELELRGGLIRIEGQVKAINIGKKINQDTAVLHFEKAQEGINGLYAAINKEVASREWQDVIYLNREEDMGNEGLRTAKLSLHPVILWKKFSAVFK